MLKLTRLIACLGLALSVAACGAPPEGVEQLEPLGDFRLGHNITVARSPTIGPLSRTVADADWEAAMETAIARQFGGFEGDKLYHIAVKIQGYIVAVPGIPVVASPKSTLIVTVSIWDNAAGGKLNAEPKQLTVLESFSGSNIVSSGITKSKEEQVRELSENAAGEILEWLRGHPEWFDGDLNVVAKAGETATGA